MFLDKGSALKVVGLILLVLILTVLTQVGGLIFLICWSVCYGLKVKHLLWKIFPPVYVLFSLAIVPKTAPFFGREEILNSENIKHVHWMYKLANRHYVTPELNAVLQDLSKVMAPEGISIICLDANFPFMDGFPLLPHLSHNDGKKIDLSLVYENQAGEIVNLQKSRSGYGVFVAPNGDETNQTQRCKSAGYFQYDYPKYLTLGGINEGLKFSEKGAKAMVSSILNSKHVSKVFLEPHLVERLQIQHPKMRFHGCGAVRHDDHVHIQIK